MRRLATSLIAALALTCIASPAAAGGPPWRGNEGGGRAEALPTPGGGGEVQAELTVPVGDGVGQVGGTGSGEGIRAVGDTPGSVAEESGFVTEFWRSTGLPCRLPIGGAAAPEDEVLYHLIEHDARTGMDYIADTDCRDPAAVPDPPPLPPPPPTPGEVTDLVRARIDVPAVGVNPDPVGLTGLATRLWYDGPRQATVSAAVRGYAVTATMRAVRFCWDPGDARTSQLCSPRPGSADDWAHEWVYETKGDYEVAVEAVWAGTWRFTGHGASASGELATIRTRGTRAYPVEEIRSQLRPAR